MSEILEESSGLESTTIGIYRTSSTVKGGRRFSFGALVVVGDRHGNVGLGYAKAPGVPSASEKAQKYQLLEGTLPHSVTGRFSASAVKLVPASPGTGVIAGGTVRAVLELAGVKDCLTKSVGSSSQINLAKAAMEGLLSLRSKQYVAELRGVQVEQTIVEEKLEAGRRFAPVAVVEKRVARPARQHRDEKKGGRRGGGRGRGRRPEQAPQQAASQPPKTPHTPTAGGDTPAA